VIVRCVHDISFSGAGNRIQGLGAYYQHATLEHRKSPRCIRRMSLDVDRHAGECVQGYGYYSKLVR
jgi:hypothetical protein